MSKTFEEQYAEDQARVARADAAYANPPGISSQAGAVMAGLYNSVKSDVGFLGNVATNTFPGLKEDSGQLAQNWGNDTILPEDMRSYKQNLEETQGPLVNRAQDLYSLYRMIRLGRLGIPTAKTGAQMVKASRFGSKTEIDGQHYNFNRPPRQGQLSRNIKSFLGDVAL